jgi:hypothetical protein
MHQFALDPIQTPSVVVPGTTLPTMSNPLVNEDLPWKRPHAKTPPSTQPPTLTQATLQSPLQYQTGFHIWLPRIPSSGPRDIPKFTDLRQAFGSLYCHLWSHDPSTTFVSKWALQSINKHPSFALTLGPLSPLTDYPQYPTQLRSYIHSTKSVISPWHIKWYIVLQHTVEPSELLKRINSIDKYQHKTYRATSAVKFWSPQIDERADKSKIIPTGPLPRPDSNLYLPSALSLILKTHSVPEAHAPFWEPSRTLPPMTSQVNNPQLPKWNSPVLFSSSRHSAYSKTSQGLRWLLVVLEQQRTTSWDMATSSRLWS